LTVVPEQGVVTSAEKSATGGHPIKQSVIVWATLSSVMATIGFAVFAPAHDREFGVVASVNEVLLPVPGQGQPSVLIVETELNIIPLAVVDVADMGNKP
jgi:hypothetical protein